MKSLSSKFSRIMNVSLPSSTRCPNASQWLVNDERRATTEGVNVFFPAASSVLSTCLGSKGLASAPSKPLGAEVGL